MRVPSGCVVCLLALACSAPVRAQPAPLLPTGFVDDTLVTGLDEPNSMAFLPDGRLLFTELRTGWVRMVVNGHLAATDPVITVDSVSTSGFERGLQGIAVDPRWPASPHVYVAFTRLGNRMRLVRYTASGDVADPDGENLTLGSKLVLIDDLRDDFQNHNGLGLRFGVDGHLLMTTGDDSEPCSAQDPALLWGKLLRIDVSRLPAGGGYAVPCALLIPPDNPIASPDSNTRLIYALGFRNPWRFHIDPQTGSVLLADVGENDYEELNEIPAGGNFGWPFREGPLVRTWGGCTEPGGSVFVDPLIAMNHDATGFYAILTADVRRPVPGAAANWPSVYNGDVFYGDYYRSRLRRIRPSGGGWVTPAPVPGQPNAQDWADGLYWAADFKIGPDASLWWLKSFDNSSNPSSGMVRRIRYAGDPVGVGGAPPRAFSLAAAPNPFRDRVVLSWRGDGPAAAEVFDLAGRRVWSGPNASRYEIEWDGRDGGGIPVPVGVYLARVACPAGPEWAKLLRFR
jgi:glucose/arabinose dehydrogenase